MNPFQQWVEKHGFIPAKPALAAAPAPLAPVPHTSAAPAPAVAEVKPQALKENSMSKLSQALNAIGSFFENNKSVTTAAAPVVQNLATAAAAAEEALPQIADAAANAALATLGPIGSAFSPLADEFIDQVIAALESKKSTAVAPAT